MYLTKYFNVANEVLEVPYSEKLEFLVGVEFDDTNDNIWSAFESVEIKKYNDKYLLIHTIPAGYSSYTYDPDTNYRFEDSLERLLQFHVDQDNRDQVESALKDKGYL